MVAVSGDHQQEEDGPGAAVVIGPGRCIVGSGLDVGIRAKSSSFC